MLSLAHTATGALIATRIANPLLSIPLIFASHYLEDYILHWDCGTGLSNGSRNRSDALKYELLDLFVSFLFILIVFQLPHNSLNYSAWFGGFISLLPDFMESPRNFLKWEPVWLKPINRFHKQFHRSTPNIAKGLLPQILVLLAVSILA